MTEHPMSLVIEDGWIVTSITTQPQSPIVLVALNKKANRTAVRVDTAKREALDYMPRLSSATIGQLCNAVSAVTKK